MAAEEDAAVVVATAEENEVEEEEEGEMEQLPSTSAAGAVATTSTRRRRFSAAQVQPSRVKKVMQSDREIGRMQHTVPVAVGRAMEHFASRLLEQTADVTRALGAKTVTLPHMKHVVETTPFYSFLRSQFTDVPALPHVPTLPHSFTGKAAGGQQSMSVVAVEERSVSATDDKCAVTSDGNDVSAVSTSVMTTGKKRGRKPKNAAQSVDANGATADGGTTAEVATTIAKPNDKEPKKKRGRPRKRAFVDDLDTDGDAVANGATAVVYDDVDVAVGPPPIKKSSAGAVVADVSFEFQPDVVS